MLVPLVLVCACKSEPKVAEDPAQAKKVAPWKPPSVLDRYPIRSHLASNAREETNGEVKKTRHEEAWTRTSDDPPQWTLVASDLDGDKLSSKTKFRLTDEGLVYEAFILEGKELTITPPKIRIPRAIRRSARSGRRSTSRGQRSMSAPAISKRWIRAPTASSAWPA